MEAAKGGGYDALFSKGQWWTEKRKKSHWTDWDQNLPKVPGVKGVSPARGGGSKNNPFLLKISPMRGGGTMECRGHDVISQ